MKGTIIDNSELPRCLQLGVFNLPESLRKGVFR